ncbi:MAG: isoprenyl transferase [Bacteroidetes bacterium]|nr:isoprenyl transferase [Bacteroidota bacterium]
MSFKDKINLQQLPKHIAIIMDGNGRWAKQKGKLRTFGHQNGVAAVRDTVEAAAELGINFITLYAFSTENWNRPAFEVNALMELLVSTIHKETKTLMDNDIKLLSIGDIESLPKSCKKQLAETIEKTSGNKRMALVLALSYSSRWEIVNAVKQIAQKVQEGKLKSTDVDDKLIEQHLTTSQITDPELLIRTSGEYRISNFLLWQIAYSELYFTDKLWPDFRREDLYQAIVDFQKRERRFGGVTSVKPQKQHA